MYGNQALLRDHLIGCTKDVLAAYHVPVDEVTVEVGELASPKLGSAICFEGDGIHGELGLVAPVATMRSSYPVPGHGDTATDAEVQSWAGELTNLVLGKLKRRLLLAGVDIQSGVPRSLSAQSLDHGVSASPGAVSLHLRANSGKVGLLELWLDAVVPDDLDLDRASQIPPAVLAEGEVLLF